jgi:hypothetical protein
VSTAIVSSVTEIVNRGLSPKGSCTCGRLGFWLSAFGFWPFAFGAFRSVGNPSHTCRRTPSHLDFYLSSMSPRSQGERSESVEERPFRAVKDDLESSGFSPGFFLPQLVALACEVGGLGDVARQGVRLSDPPFRLTTSVLISVISGKVLSRAARLPLRGVGVQYRR